MKTNLYKRISCFFVGILLSALTTIQAQSEIKLNEIQSVNGNTIQDEDGDFEDWIEIINTSDTANINLFGYGLSDNNNAYKWKFPSYVLKKKTNGVYDRILVFASGKDRYTQVNHWEMVINSSDSWKYLANVTGTTATPNWYSFINNGWASGAGGIGYGDNDDATTVPFGTLSVYMQKQFNITDTSKIDGIAFAIDYDDGFVAYINGIEIARKNIIASPAWNTTAIQDYEASMYSAGGKPEIYLFSNSQWKSFLHNGTNILSVEVHNFSATSSDLSAIPFLIISNKEPATSYTSPPSWFPYKAKYFHTNFKIDNNGETITLAKPNIGGSGTMADIAYLSPLQYNSSFARQYDGSSFWKIVYPPTPNQSNNSSTAYNGYTDTPVINLASGFYNSPQTITISRIDTINTQIRYTTNGNIPKKTDILYTGPFTITDTITVIKARVFSNNDSVLVAGGIANGTFFINCKSTLPIVSITIDSIDLYDYNTGIYVKGPGAGTMYPYKGANFWQDWERAAHIEYYDDSLNNRTKRFSADGLIGIFGNYTRAKPQKSFDFKVKALYDSASVNYQFFPERTKTKFDNFVLRMAGSDWMDAHLRDEFVHRFSFNDGIYSTATRTVVGYLNGKYWGVYHIREKGDEKYLSSLSGVDKDSIDQIRTSGRDYAANGDMNAFNSMINFFNTTDLSITSNYNTAKTLWNIDNFMTYYATEMYAINDDWISVSQGEYWFNNIKLWRPRGTNEAKWNYQLHDIDQGMQLSLVNYKIIDSVLAAKTLNNHSMMLSKFLANSEFKRQFINKFFDLFNTSFREDTLTNTLNRFVNLFKSEMDHACRVFPTNPGMHNSTTSNTLENFNTNINGIKSFISQRKNILRSHLVNYFGLANTDTARITVGDATADINKGKVKLNSLKPSNQFWTGTYLKNNPIDIVAIAEPGYVFDYWEPSNNTNMSMVKNVSNGEQIIAHFTEAPKIVITELNYKSEPTRNSGDWIEINNNSQAQMDLSGWKIKKTFNSQLYTIPNGTILNPGAYLVFVYDTNIFRSQYGYIQNKLGPTYLNFNDIGEEIQLINNFDNVIIRFTYSDTATWPDCARGYGRTLQIIDKSLNPNKGNNWTCGCMGGSPGKAYTVPCPEKIIFNEINYNSLNSPDTDADDWIEIKNIADTAINLSGWTIKDDMDDHNYVFPQGTILNPKSYLVLAHNFVNFNSVYPPLQFPFINKIGPFNFGLSGNSEGIRLYNSSGKIYQSMYYKDKSPWPDSANGHGYTLELISDTANPTSPYSWESYCFKGSPGGENVIICSTYGVNENNKDIKIKMYPNPASEFITIEAMNIINSEAYIQIYDLQGRLLISQKLSNNETQNISLISLHKGMYIYRISDSQTVIGAGKILKE